MPVSYDLRLTGYVGSYNFNTRDVDDACRRSPKHLDILVDSTGGDAATALSICHALQDHPSVHVHLRGMNASAATVVAMGADRVTMASTGLFLIHCSRMDHFAWETMTAEDMRRHIESLDESARQLAKIDLAIASLYSKRTGMKVEQVLELMSREEWLTASEARDLGFVDEITDYEDEREKCRLSACLKDVMLSAGMPLPKVERKEEKASFLKKILNSIKMPKNYEMPKAVASACGLKEAPLDADGRVCLAAESVGKMDAALLKAEEREADALKRADQAEASMKEAVARAEKAEADLAALKAQTPADAKSPDKVIEDSAKGSAIADYCQSMLDASKTFRSLP